ncbi:MAG: hypothetical protein MJZ38_04170 [archaeon]|nr:hypothetical protein [archaeon]
MDMFYVAAALAFAPALLLMYLLLRPYTYPATEHPYFSDPSFFMLFAVGLVGGTIMFLVYSYIANSVIAVIVYSLIQVMVIVACLNLKRYRGKSDSIFYGFGFGLGAGATTGMGLIYWFATSASRLGGSLEILDYVFLFVLSLAMTLQFSSIGITVGDGIARHNPMQFAVQAMIYNFVFWMVFSVTLLNSGSSLYFYGVSVMCLAISVMYLLYAYKKEIGTMVAEVNRMAKKGKKFDE